MAENQTTNRAKQARRYGYRVEQQLADKYGLDLDRDEMHDAVTESNEPVEMKSCKYTLSDGREGVFSIREQSHNKIQQKDGWYCFAVYRPRGSGAEILESKIMRARAVRIVDDRWQSVSGKQNRAQIKFSEIL